MKKISLIILASIVVLLHSCGAKTEYENIMTPESLDDMVAGAYEEATEAAAMDSEMQSKKDNAIPKNATIFTNRKLIKEGNITFETDDCEQTKKLIQQVAKNLNGYLSTDNEWSSEYRVEHNITIRVPSEKFDQLLVDISNSVKEVDDQNISVRDVTEEYVDVEARLIAKKKVEVRYLELLNKAHSVGDILQIENELARLREQIEATEGRLRYLKNQVSLSTLTIRFYETLDAPRPGFEFLEKAGNGFHNGFNGLLWFFIGLINIWPLILFLVLSIWFIIKMVKRSIKKSKKM